MLEEIQTNEAIQKDMVDLLIAVDVITPLVNCLTNRDNANATKDNAARILEIIAEKRPNESGLANAEQTLMQWLTNSMADNWMLKYAATFFLTKAENKDEAVRLRAVSAIYKVLEESLTNGTTKKLIDMIISVGMAPLYVCFKGDSTQSTLMSSARALEIMAKQCPEKTYNLPFFNDLLKWLETPTQLNDEVIKQMASILRNLSAHIPSDDRKDKLDKILPLIESQNPHIVEQAAFAAFNLIRNMEQMPDFIKVKHIQSMMQFSPDVKFFYRFIEEEKGSNKLTTKILTALKMLLLNPSPNDEQIVKQIQQYRSEIELFNIGSETIAARIISLLENRLEIQRYTIVPTTTAGPRISEIFDTEIKKVLGDTVRHQLLYPDHLKSFSTPPNAILLFNEHGSGKETLAKAVANEADAKLFSLSASSIIAKEENDAIEFIKMLFKMAKNSEPTAVILINEIDELLGHGTKSDRPLRYMTKQRARAEFLVQMSNYSYCSSSSSSLNTADDRRYRRVLVIGATKRPWEMNNNTLRHFAKRIYVEMPDKAARTKILQKIIDKNNNDFSLISKADVDKLAALTENYSFDHLRELCQGASLDALRSDGAKVGLHSKQSVTITMTNFENAYQNIMPFTREENAKKLEEFAGNHRFAKRQKIQKI